MLIGCIGRDLGVSIADGLASCGGGPSDRPSRSLRVAPADFRPGAVPAHPGPAHRGASAVALQVPGELGGGVLAAPARGRRIVFPVVYGHLRAAMSIASHIRTSAACCRPNRVPDCFLRAAAGDGCQVDRALLPGCGYSPGADIRVGVARPTALPAGWRREPAPDQVGARVPGRRARGWWCRVLSAGLRPGGPWERTGGCAPPPGVVSTPLRAPAA